MTKKSENVKKCIKLSRHLFLHRLQITTFGNQQQQRRSKFTFCNYFLSYIHGMCTTALLLLCDDGEFLSAGILFQCYTYFLCNIMFACVRHDATTFNACLINSDITNYKNLNIPNSVVSEFQH